MAIIFVLLLHFCHGEVLIDINVIIIYQRSNKLNKCYNDVCKKNIY